MPRVPAKSDRATDEDVIRLIGLFCEWYFQVWSSAKGAEWETMAPRKSLTAHEVVGVLRGLVSMDRVAYDRVHRAICREN